MPAQITLRVIKGKLRGEQFVFADRTTCIVGRGEGCYPRLPNDADHKKVSRQHCLLDINPPDIRVRDFGSLNGTFVNGHKIGQRPGHLLPGGETAGNCPEHDLGVGDELTVGGTTFQIDIVFAPVCAECWTEIPDGQAADCLQAPSLYQCAACRRKALAQKETTPWPPPRACSRCGRDLGVPAGESRAGTRLCAACQQDSAEVALSQLPVQEAV